jgi:hypothetical protein
MNYGASEGVGSAFLVALKIPYALIRSQHISITNAGRFQSKISDIKMKIAPSRFRIE